MWAMDQISRFLVNNSDSFNPVPCTERAFNNYVTNKVEKEKRIVSKSGSFSVGYMNHLFNFLKCRL